MRWALDVADEPEASGCLSHIECGTVARTLAMVLGGARRSADPDLDLAPDQTSCARARPRTLP